MVKQGPRPLVICGPSGSGKSTLLKRLFKEFPNTFGFSVSHTTRKPRPGEENGVHYHFVTVEHMQKGIENGDFIETAVFSGNMYGTRYVFSYYYIMRVFYIYFVNTFSEEAVETVQENGKVCVLDIEIEGVKQIRNSHLNPIFVFIEPPSLDELEKRLRNRKTETEESLQARLNTARTELAYGTTPGNFDITIQNHNFKDAYTQLREFILKQLELQLNEGINVTLHQVDMGGQDFDHS